MKRLQSVDVMRVIAITAVIAIHTIPFTPPSVPIGQSFDLATVVNGLARFAVPLFFILLYAFTTDEKTLSFPPPGLTTQWFAVALERQDVWAALWLSVKVAAISTLFALVMGTLAAAAMWKSRAITKWKWAASRWVS